MSILVATGFVRIDADTKPALKSIQALGSIGGNFLATAIGPAVTAVVTGIASVTAAAATAGGAVAVYGVAVKQQFSQIQEVMQKKTAAEDADTKATNAKTIAQRLAKDMGIKYGQSIEITKDMTEEARQKAETYNSALSAATSATKAAKMAQEGYKSAMGELPPETAKTAEALQNLKDTTKSWSDTLSSTTMPIFTRGIQFLTRLLPTLTPIVKSVAGEIESWVGTLGEGTAGRVFREFGDNVKSNGAGALRTFLDVGRNLIVGITGILNAFMPMSVGVTGGLEKMTARFAEWGASLGSNRGFATFTTLAQDAGPRLVQILGSLGSAFVKVAASAGPLAGVGLRVLEVMAALIDAIPTPVLRLLVPALLATNLALKLYAIYQAAAAAATWLFSTSVVASNGAVASSRAALILFRIQQVAAAVATGAVTVATWAATAATWAWNAALAVATSPITLVVVAIAALVAGIVWVATKTTWFQTAWKYTWNAVKQVGTWIGNWFSGPFVQFFLAAWDRIKRYVVDPVVWFFTRGIPAAAGVLKDLTLRWILGLISGAATAYGAIKRNVFDPMIRFFTVHIPNGAKTLRDKVVGWWWSFRNAAKVTWEQIYKWVISPIIRYFTVHLPNGAKILRDKVVGWWWSFRNAAKVTWEQLYKWVIGPILNYFTVRIPNGARNLRDRVVGWWGSLRDGVRGAYHWMRDKVFSPLGRFFTSTIPGWAGTMKNRVVGFFRDMRDGLGRAWGGIRNKAKAPINWVIDHVWNRGIQNIWEKITGWIGIKNSLKDIKLLAAGGTVGTTPIGMFNRPTAIVGEGNPQHPEFVIPTDPKYKSRALALYQAAGAYFMKDGGILGSIGGWISNAAGAVGSAAKGAADFLTDPVGRAKKLLLGTMKGIGALGNSSWVKMITQLPQKAIDGLVRAVKKVGSNFLSGIGLGPSGGSGVKRWSGVVQAMLRQVGQPPGLLGITLKRMNQESGGNPNIVNKWDSNWQRGTPSVGLMQVIGPTFRAYAGKYRKTGPFLYGVSVNPAANIYSSMKYALSRYGSLASAYGRPGGYELGTDGATAGWHWVGENGPELAKLPAGTRIRSTRASARQAPAQASVIHLTVENHGVIGSKHEVEDWLVGSLETLRVKRRLPRALGGTA